jgi:hypothetical protein
MIRFLLLFLCFWLTLAAPAGAQLLAPGEKAMWVELVAEGAVPAGGGKVALALRMTPRPGWHGYWEKPGRCRFRKRDGMAPAQRRRHRPVPLSGAGAADRRRPDELCV